MAALLDSQDASTRTPALLISEEAQDLILSYIDCSKDHMSVQQTSYRSFCLVSRHWLPAGRRALYRTPLDLWLPYWPVATTFLITLETYPRLASHVRNLVNLQAYTDALKSRTTSADKLRLASSLNLESSNPHDMSEEWAARVLSACQSAQSASYNLSTPSAAAAFATSTPTTLDRLSLTASEPESIKMWKGSFRQDLKYLEIETGSFSPSLRLDHSRLPFKVEALTLNKTGVNLNLFLSFLPINVTALTSLTLKDVFPMFESVTAIELLAIVGPHLETFVVELFEADFETSDSFRLSDYPTGERENMPMELFYPLPSLRRLRIVDYRTLTVEKLALINQHSPHLHTLDLELCFWSFPRHLMGPLMAFSVARPLLEAFFVDPRTFPKLKTLHLGRFPIDNATINQAEDLAQLVAACEGRGLNVKHKVCSNTCYECDEFPEDCICGPPCGGCGQQAFDCECDDEDFGCEACGEGEMDCDCYDLCAGCGVVNISCNCVPDCVDCEESMEDCRCDFSDSGSDQDAEDDEELE